MVEYREVIVDEYRGIIVDECREIIVDGHSSGGVAGPGSSTAGSRQRQLPGCRLFEREMPGMNGAPTEPTERYVSDVDGCEEGRGGVKVSGVRHNGDASVRLLPPSQIGDFQRRPWQPQGSGCRQHQPLSPVQVRVVAACLSWTRAHSLPPSIIETPTSPAPSPLPHHCS